MCITYHCYVEIGLEVNWNSRTQWEQTHWGPIKLEQKYNNCLNGYVLQCTHKYKIFKFLLPIKWSASWTTYLAELNAAERVSSNSDGSQLMITLTKRAFFILNFLTVVLMIWLGITNFFNTVTRGQHCTCRFVLGLLNRFFINCEGTWRRVSVNMRWRLLR